MLIQLMQTMSHPSSLASLYQFILLGEQEHTSASEPRSELLVRMMKSVSRLEPGFSGSDRAPISRTQEHTCAVGDVVETFRSALVMHWVRRW